MFLQHTRTSRNRVESGCETSVRPTYTSHALMRYILKSSSFLLSAGRYAPTIRSSADSGGDVSDCYDVPPRAVPVIPSPASSPSPAPSCYDIPRPPKSYTPNSNCSAGSAGSLGSGMTPLDCYDVPRPLQPLTPSSSASSLTNDGSLSGSNR